MDDRSIIRAVRSYRERLLSDPYRPGYHFAVPDDNGMPGDPNGCFYANGRHHLMYLYSRDEANFRWGHVSSADLLHWRHHPDALREFDFDRGCFSGGAFVDEDGKAYLSYWIVDREGANPPKGGAGIGLAVGFPPHFDVWERLPAVIESTSWGIRVQDGEPIGCSDPSNIFKIDGVYYMQLGNLPVLNAYGRDPDSDERMRGDWVELFSSTDLLNWQYEGRFYQRKTDNSWTDETEDDMCPSFLPLPASKEGDPPTDRWLQLFISHNKGAQYYIGTYADKRFHPITHGRMSWVDNTFFAPEAYIDGRGRQIMFSWLTDNIEGDFKKYGWSGVFSLPRVLWLAQDDSLGIAPAPELEALRINPQSFADIALDDGEHALALHYPASAEIRFRMRASEGRAGVKLRMGDQSVEIYFDRDENALIFDSTRCGPLGRPAVERAPLTLAEGEPLDLIVYTDKSVIEAFVNDRQAICRRAYPDSFDGMTVSLFTEGPAAFSSIRGWEMMPSFPY